jgi:hypothetical protein
VRHSMQKKNRAIVVEVAEFYISIIASTVNQAGEPVSQPVSHPSMQSRHPSMPFKHAWKRDKFSSELHQGRSPTTLGSAAWQLQYSHLLQHRRKAMYRTLRTSEHRVPKPKEFHPAHPLPIGSLQQKRFGVRPTEGFALTTPQTTSE